MIKYDAAGSISSLFRRREENGETKAIARAACCFLIGFISSRAIIFGKCAPFGAAAVAAAGSGDGIFVLVGSIIGYLIPGGPGYPLRYVAQTAAVFLLKWVLSGFDGLTARPAFAPSLAAATSAVTGIAVVAAGSSLPYDILVFLAEVLLCGCAASFFGQAFGYIANPASVWKIKRREFINVSVCLCIILIAVERIQFSGISLGRIAAVFIILCAAFFGGEAWGAVMGVTAGFMMSLGGGTASVLIGGYSLGGFICGIFYQSGRLCCTAVFILSSAMALAVASPESTAVFAFAYETAAAAAVFLLIPERFLCRISAIFVPAQEQNDGYGTENMIKRLSVTADTFEEISGVVSDIHKKLSHISNGGISDVYKSAEETICRNCGMHTYCWDTVYDDTVSALGEISFVLRKNKILTRDDVPKHFAGRCCRLGDFTQTLNRCYAEYSAHRSAQLKTEQLRRLISPGFYNAASILRNIAADFSSVRICPGGSGRVRSALASCGVNVLSSQIVADTAGRIAVDAVIEDNTVRVSRDKLLSAIDAACGREMTGPRIVNGEDGATHLKFMQKPRFSVTFGEAAIQKTGETLCGDACESFIDEKGRALLILSDGMGCGGTAAVDSNLTVRLMSKLLKCGFGFDESAEIASSAILAKSSDESFSTIDVACIDLYDGKADFIKAGAPPTYVRRAGSVERIEPCSMPIGILPKVKLERTSLRLRKGDVIVVLSDGALAQGDAFIIHEMEKFKGEPRAFARFLVKEAKRQRGDGHDDDITVMVAAVS